jgi:hypothetical protein
MLRRSFLIAGIGLLPVAGKAKRAHASEALAAIPKASVIELNANSKARIEAVIEKNGYRQVGEMRRKGQLISTVAERAGGSWKLVLDAESGEIVGRRLLPTNANVGD